MPRDVPIDPHPFEPNPPIAGSACRRCHGYRTHPIHTEPRNTDADEIANAAPTHRDPPSINAMKCTISTLNLRANEHTNEAEQDCRHAADLEALLDAMPRRLSPEADRALGRLLDAWRVVAGMEG